MRSLLLVALLVSLGIPLSARATTVDDLCAAPGVAQGNKPCFCASSPARCRFTKSPGFVLTPNSVLDFGTRRLELAPGAKIDAGVRGTLDVRAADVEMEATTSTSAFTAAGGRIRVLSSGSVNIRAAGANRSRIDVAGADSSDITIEAANGVLVEGLISASATVIDQFAGDVTINARTVTVTGLIEVKGNATGSAGIVTIDTTLIPPAVGGDINLTSGSRIDATSGDSFGSGIDLTADGDVFANGTLDLQGTRAGGGGGFLAIDAAGSVTVGGTVRAGGESSTTEAGDAGDVQVDAGGSISLTGFIDLGGPPAGSGGSAAFTAGMDITQTGRVDCLGRGSNGFGGEAVYAADRAITLGAIDCSADPTSTNSSGGVVDATAWCSLTVPAGRLIDTRGPDGSTTLASGGTMTIAGTLRSTAGNALQYRDTPPTIAPTAVIAPPLPGPQQISGLIPCGGNPRPGCGNGTTDPGETCDDGNATPCDGCSASCQVEGCGNGTTECAEACDDGNTTSCDGCRSDCSRSDDMCGDGIPECGEQADDGNNQSCDGVSADCRQETCGNGVRECGEQCDGGPGGSSTCSPQCTAIIVPGNCGNGTLDPNEDCDDGNTTPCDGCSATCTTDGCGSGSLEAACGEQCDDFNTTSGDGCSATCQDEVCGNGVADAGEACDDGNQNNCDGCANDCTIPTSACPVCAAGSTEDCVPCAATIDCDPLRACGSSACVAGVCTPVSPPSCDDGNLCTTDRCDPSTGCVSTVVTCQDTCAGTQSCDPGTGQCLAGPAPDCDDEDACTVDTCR